MAGRTKEAEKMTLDIISREGSCIECYRLLSAIYSKRGNYTEVCMCVWVSVMAKITHSMLRQSHSEMTNSQQEMVTVETNHLRYSYIRPAAFYW